MNRAALKAYAPKARLDFIRAVTDRAAFFGLTPKRTEPMQATGDVVIISGRPFAKAVARQRRSLDERIQRHGFDQVMEATAYTWFNRFVALRYMELHGYLDHGYRVLSHPAGKPTPEILEQAEHVTLPGLDTKKAIDLKLDGTKEAELYGLLLVAQCNTLHEAMPFLFERIADDTELLLPDNLLHSDSIIRKLANEIDEADWQQVEIIGWLYQFYISDKYDEVIGKVVKSEDIPAATQRFTPNWIVKYLVQNTLGRQWLATYPDSSLRQQMEYYIEPAEQTDGVKAKLAAITPKSLDPETLTLLDPAAGSGHILVEGYDLFKAIYQERGYRSKDIPRLILEKNLFGLEIDDRAAQLAAFALLMKARADDRRIFADRIQPNVLAIQESKGLESLLWPDAAATAHAGESPFADSDLFPETQRQLTLTAGPKESPLVVVEPCLRELITLFEHGKTFGSLVRVPAKLASELPAARQHIEAMSTTGQLWEHRAVTLLLPLVKQAELLAKTYDSFVTNPPYMGRGAMNPLLARFTQEAYTRSRYDLMTCFMERGFEFAPSGLVGMINQHSWMFLSRFEGFRNELLLNGEIPVLAHLGARAFPEISGEVVQSTAFVISRRRIGETGVYIRLVDFKSSEEKAIHLTDRSRRFERATCVFAAIPGQILAYWASDTTLKHLSQDRRLGAVGEARRGLQTGDAPRFIRFWFEVALNDTEMRLLPRDECVKSPKRWFLFNNGGEFCKWSGNVDYVVNWEHNGAEIKATGKAIIPSEDRYFLDAITWSRLSGGRTAFRYMPQGIIPGDTGPCIFLQGDKLPLLAYLNSTVARHFLDILVPSMTFLTGDIENLPITERIMDISTTSARRCFDLAEADWKEQETAWNFGTFRMLSLGTKATVSEAWSSWRDERNNRLTQTTALEAENNRLFIEHFDFSAELSSNISGEEITLYRADRQQDIQRLISYAIGCMTGRYSLDTPGLVYANSCNKGFDPSQYRTFPADADGIIPVTELAWFPHDATERVVEFVGTVWPREHLENNLKFVAESLGPNRDEHPRDTIRRYLATGFYKDHLSVYKKRPIYWLFSSGKQRAFQCLVYLHRYHEGTLARMRTESVIPLQGMMSQRIEKLGGDIAAATSTSTRRKLEKEREALVKQRTELAAFDEKLRHYADQRIALDLDDGVKVNYGKFGDLLADVKAVTGGTEE